MRIVLSCMMLLAVAFAGCTGANFAIAADVAGQGNMSQGVKDDVNFPCNGKARVNVGIQGQGHIVVTVRDAVGAKMAEVTLNDQGQKGIDREVSGASGSWNLKVEVKDWGAFYTGGVDFQGQYAAAVFCDAPA